MQCTVSTEYYIYTLNASPRQCIFQYVIHYVPCAMHIIHWILRTYTVNASPQDCVIQSVLHQITLRQRIHFTKLLQELHYCIIAAHKIHKMNSMEWSHIICSLHNFHSITSCFCFILLPRMIFNWQ